MYINLGSPLYRSNYFSRYNDSQILALRASFAQQKIGVQIHPLLYNNFIRISICNAKSSGIFNNLEYWIFWNMHNICTYLLVHTIEPYLAVKWYLENLLLQMYSGYFCHWRQVKALHWDNAKKRKFHHSSFDVRRRTLCILGLKSVGAPIVVKSLFLGQQDFWTQVYVRKGRRRRRGSEHEMFTNFLNQGRKWFFKKSPSSTLH